MNIEQLEYIVEVAKAGSLSVASQNLHVTQSAISQSIAHLESELGVKIFIRSRSGAKPTDIGSKVIQKAVEALMKLQELREVSDSANLLCGELRIGTVPGPMMFLPGTLSAYKADYPNIQIAITEKATQEIIDDIKQDKIDIGLIGLTRSLIEMQDKVDYEVVLRGKMIAALSKNSPLAFASTITPEEIRQHPLVLYDDDRVWEFIRDFSGKHGPVNILFSTNNLDAIRNAVRENLAITIGFDYTIRHDPYILTGQGVPVAIAGLEQEDSCLALVWQKTSHNAPAARNFILRFKTQLQDM
ncbi:LysR family transcriptional regulator [Alicyclobacillus mengziensis]|uniref:LysR family transcriptional regulator n=1 Tax=Alicyclobacillus mengziensis TaxID=2931921 RepID=A0A9X7VUV1_9BACL|nr:LysR family transcriptional regulator [Alicyclobacillus mengziensis]QSO45536.1 LysR family transcriptional regulator [Alicyclobacillus mengziensis]